MVPALLLVVGAAPEPATGPSPALFLVPAALLIAAALRFRARPGAHLALFLASLLSGRGLAALAAQHTGAAQALSGRTVRLEGRVEETASFPFGTRVRLGVARADDAPAAFGAELWTAPGSPLWPGQQVALATRLKPLDGPQNPAERDRRAPRVRRGVVGSGGFEARALVRLSPPAPWRLALERERQALAADCARRSPSPAAAALYLTLAAGLRAQLDAAVEEDFARSGLAHVLSVSGLHVAALALALLAALRWLLVRLPGDRLRAVDARRLAALPAGVLLWGYVVFTGSQPPAVRSALMLSAWLLGLVVWRRSDALNAAALAAMVMVAVEPACLQELSVQLSFAAVLALLLLAPAVRAALPVPKPSPLTATPARLRLQRWREAAVGTFAASVAATAVTAPILAATFGRVSLAGLLSNVLCLPLFGVATLLAAGGAAVHALSPLLSEPLLWAGGQLSALLLAIAQGFARLPFAAIAVGPFGTALAVLWWAGLLAFALLEGGWRRLAWLSPLAALLSVAAGALAPPAGLEVTFLSVGHGDAIVLRSGGQTALIDGGGVPGGADPGARVVLPFLKAAGVERLQLAALSHAHPDHALGLTSAVAALGAERLWLPAGTAGGPLLTALRAAAGSAVVESVELGHAPLRLGEATLEILGPPIDRVLLEGENDRSMVLRVRHGAVSFLLTGDLEEAGEELLEPGAVTVMKAPHHGSRTSSSQRLLDRARPRHVVFCVGRRNRFGFPHPEVVERYQALGAQCLRTDLDGAITFTSDGAGVSVRTFLQRREAGPAQE